MNYRSSVFVAAALAALTACTSTVDVPPLRPFAFLDVNAVDSAGQAGHYVVQAQGIFTKARITGVIGSGDLNERCSPATDIAPVIAYTDTPVDPGTVKLTLHGNVDTTTRNVPLERHVFQVGSASNAENWMNSTVTSIKPGSDTVTYTVTGVAGGFPPFTIRAATVTDFTTQAVDDSATGTGVRVQWSQSPNPATAMQISLQFADTASDSPSTIVNKEIVCVARDDGDFSINRTFLEPWEEAGTDSLGYKRQVVFSRFLTTTTSVADAIITVVVRRDRTVLQPH